MRFEASLVDRALAHRLSPGVESHGMGSCYPMQQPREPRRSRSAQQQVPVVRHDAIGHQRHLMVGQAVSQNLQKLAIIPGSQEDGRSADAAIDDVEVVFVLKGSGTSRHDGDLC